MVRFPRTSLEQVDTEATLQLILKNAVQALRGSAGVVAVWNEAENRYVAGTAWGLESDVMDSLSSILEEAAPDLAASRQSFTLLSILRPDLDRPLFSISGVRLDPIICLPLKIGNKSLGLIFILRPSAALAFSPLDQSVLAAFAEQAAIALQNSRLADLLSKEKQRIEAVLENSADGIMSIDARCRLLGFNTALEKMTGYSRDEVLGQRCSNVLSFTDAEKGKGCEYNCPMNMSTSDRQLVFEQQGTIRTRDGRNVDVSMIYSVVRAPDGSPLNAVVNVRDISKMREMENFRDAILSMLGHELQTPLAIIKGYTDTLSRADGKWDQETIRQGLQAIEEESDRLSQVMNKLLLASRISAGALKLNKEPVQLSAIAEKVVRRVHNLTDKHEFKTDFAADFPTVMVEPQLMEQVFSNLFENAVKYSPKGGKITISGKRIKNTVSVTVADEGIGIPPADMDHLFERFYRGEKGKSSKIQGTGLGLYICKSIVEAHGGRLTASSQTGKGSEFTFTLPVEKE